MARASLDDEIAAVRAICHDLGLGHVTPAILKAAHHTTLRLDPLGLVARVQTSGDHAEAGVRAMREIAVARHLAARGAPVIAPCDARLAGPHTTPSGVVTLWPYVDHQRMADEDDALVAATALAAVHDGLADYPGNLPRYTRGLDRCWTMLSPGRHGDGLSREDRALLATHYTRLRRVVETADVPSVPLHGDAHPGNLLLGGRGPYWIDFEDVCRGPAELDIACLPSAAWPHFVHADQVLVEQCADLKSVCVAIWCSADRTRSADMREAADYHLARVRRMTR